MDGEAKFGGDVDLVAVEAEQGDRGQGRPENNRQLCRNRGKNLLYCGGNDIEEVAWYSQNSGGGTHAVGGKKDNGIGIHDMSGNVWEWCQDWYGDYPEGLETDPTGPQSGTGRVLRGGSWLGDARPCRSSNRFWNSPALRYARNGFRLVFPAGQ